MFHIYFLLLKFFFNAFAWANTIDIKLSISVVHTTFIVMKAVETAFLFDSYSALLAAPYL